MNLLACILLLSGANAYHDTFNQACTAFSKGDYTAAILSFEQLVAEGVADPAVFYNLGNAYYRSGRLGPAIANYERALALEPSFENAQENLAKAIRETKHHLARPGTPPGWKLSLFFWHYDTARHTTYLLAMLFWWAFWIAVGVRFWKPIPYLRRAAVALGVLAVAFGVSAWYKAHLQDMAVAVGERVAAHYGTDESETVRFELALTTGGERGWVHDTDLVFVGPPYTRPPEPAANAAPGGAIKK
ncbi:MAG: tetratricopeptide repeat protein [Candidatus Hydrogenedentes bacterium]|nr:tetratricopeptide repeat protein [Candidatus Hydrogenedentota bacterium]